MAVGGVFCVTRRGWDECSGPLQCFLPGDATKVPESFPEESRARVAEAAIAGKCRMKKR